MHANIDKLVDCVANDVDTTPSENIVDSTETTTNPHVEPHVEPYGEPSVEPSTEPIIDIHVFNTYVNDILDKRQDSYEDASDENPENEEPEVQGDKNV